jgi:L-asparaginase
VSTGGTILSSGDSPFQLTNYTCHGTTIKDVLGNADWAEDINLDCREIFTIPSSRITYKHWKKLIEFLNEEIRQEDVMGAVVAHGTDTLEESAFFANLFLKTDKPVVFTGAMRPNTALGSDGALNLFNSVQIVLNSTSAKRGVLICLNGKISEARLTTKAHTLEPGAFQVPEYGFCGFVINGTVEFVSRCEKPHTTQTQFNISDLSGKETLPFVPIIFAYADEGAELIRASIHCGAKGIVYAGTGHGSISLEAENALNEASAKGVIVVRASRINGPVLPSKERWSKAGFIPAGTLNSIKARLLMAIALASVGNDRMEIERIFQTY